jgi:hypothetical protein
MTIDKDTLMRPGREKSSTVHMDHQGRPTPDLAGGRALARSRNDERGHIERKDEPNIARTTSVGKHAYDLKIHGGMVSQTRTGPLAHGGDHASALDSLSGEMVVPYKDGSVAAVHPLSAPPIAKQYIGKPVEIYQGMRSRVNEPDAVGVGTELARAAANKDAIRDAHHALGRAVIGEALAARRWPKG